MPEFSLLQRQPESDYCTQSDARMQPHRRVLMPSMLLMLLWLAMPMLAQARFAPKAAEAKPPELRALGVLEWTGEAGKPAASRLVPITIFTGDRYQDASLYLARPEPLALQGDTEYELLQAGIAKGRFDIFSAGNAEGSWFGYGVWKPLITARPAKLAVSKNLPEVVKDADPDRPHLGSGKTDTTKKDSSASPAKTTPTAKDASSSGSGSQTHVSSTSDDPERPRLRKRPIADNSGTQAGSESTADSAPSDPDRPKLHRGKPAGTEGAGKLTGTPPRLQQMVALSTTTNEEPHSYVYQWASPEDAAKMQSALEKLAGEALAAQHAPAIIGAPVQKIHPARAAKTPPPPILAVEDFRAFELSYSGGATLVFSCRTQDASGPEKFVTIIAQPDFYGAPRVLLKQVTDAGHLDLTPRMKLVDAVDANGDHRAELVFELRGNGERRFAIYRVASAHAEQVFLTNAIP